MRLTQVPTSAEVLQLEMSFPSTTPQTLFHYWTEPELLQKWWPQHAELAAHKDGAYHLSWPQMNWHLRGRYIVYEQDRHLTFTWRWDHDPRELAERTVDLVFEALTTHGTRLQLTHGPYLNTSEEQEIRLEHHLAGWQHFLPRLYCLCEPTE